MADSLTGNHSDMERELDQWHPSTMKIIIYTLMDGRPLLFENLVFR